MEKKQKKIFGGGVSTGGVKIALFDVSNPEKPKEIDKIEIGKGGSDSAVLHDHKAFLLDKRNSIMVIPVKEVEVEEGLFRDKTTVLDGAYAFRIDKDGFEEIGVVRHSKKKDYYDSWRSQATVMRSMYIGGDLYTISTQYIKANKLEDGLPSLNSIELPEEEEDDWWNWFE
ncbi:MAG: beta-propeller domain-containing protein [Candidatus Micrarchaeota archaeon]